MLRLKFFFEKDISGEGHSSIPLMVPNYSASGGMKWWGSLGLPLISETAEKECTDEDSERLSFES